MQDCYPKVFQIRGPQAPSGACASADVEQLHRGQRLLVIGDDVDESRFEPLEADPFVLPRALAYYDSVRAIRRPTGARAVSLSLASAHRLETRKGMIDWMVQLLSDADARFEVLAQQLCRTECYQLVRFVLEQHHGSSISSMARQYGLSDTHFYRQGKKYFGQSLKKQLRLIRAVHALLECSGRQRNFTQVALGHGYASTSHFCMEVRSLTGLSPSSLFSLVQPH